MESAGASGALHAADEEWKGAMEAVDGRMGELQTMLRDTGSDSTTLEELQKLLTMGHTSSGLLAFLTSTLGEAAVQELCTVHAVAHRYLG
jgi:hypothetical protein